MNSNMMSGYCFEFQGKRGEWENSVDDLWDIEIYTPSGKEVLIGHRDIDGARCFVFSCPDWKVRAQTAVSCTVVDE